MKLDAIASPSAKILAGLVAASALVLGSCGGGGAASGNGNDQFQGGVLRILPDPGTFYAGVPSLITITGDRLPYLLSSSDPTVLAVPAIVNSGFVTVVPNNPGVVDVGLQPGEVPRRTLTISARGSNGQFEVAEIAVLQNFLTGYGINLTSNCPTSGSATVAPPACAGGESIVSATAVTNGSLYGNRIFRWEVVRGSYQFVIPESPSNPVATLSNTYTTNTDHTGRAIARIRVNANAAPQLATIRLIDVATGVYEDNVFFISEGPPSGSITLLPASLSFTGNLTTDCGGGSSDILIFGGTAPYSIITPLNIFTNQTSVPEGNPSRFNITVPAAVTPCPTYAPVIVRDALGRQASLPITSLPGTQTLPPLAVAPSSVDMNGPGVSGCGYTASVTVVGGTGSYSASTTHPRLIAGPSGSTLSIMRRVSDTAPVPPSPPPYPTTGTISVTDGASVVTVNVTNISPSCP